MIRKIIFIVSSPLYLRDYHRFGAEILINNGFEVEFFNITPYLYPVLFSNATKKDLYIGERERYLYNESDALNEIKNVCKKSFVVLLINYNHDTRNIFRAISKAGLSYAVSVLNYVPTFASSIKNLHFFAKLKRLRVSNFRAIIINKLYSPRYGRFMGISPPDVLLMGGEMCMSHPLYSLSGPSTENLWLHTFDYDVYLQCQYSQHQTESEKAVFIDAPSPRFKFDALVPGISSPLTEAKYYPALCAFFDCLEHVYSVDIEIAAHPKSEHDIRPEYFGKRLVHHGKTAPMIRDSKIVINRNSTSVNFAVLYQKPIIFHTSDEAESSMDMSNQIKSMAFSLGKMPVNIDNFSDVDWQSEIKVDKEAYSQYKNAFIKKNGTVDTPIWQSFADWLKVHS